MTSCITDKRFADLRSRIAGRVIAPGEPGFAAACSARNLAYQHRPAAVIVPANSADVICAVSYAADNHLGVTVQTTGYGLARPADGSVLVLTSDLVDVAVDADAWTARIGGGARWRDVLGPAQDVGLAPLVGSSLDVGAVGDTLGGGMGWMARKYGLGIDHVRNLEVVTADGAIRVVSDEEHADLFRALGGGGAGGLGVVTSMEIDLVPVTRVYAGNLWYPANRAAAVGSRFRSWVEAAPDELTSALLFVRSGSRSFVVVRGCYVGPDTAGESTVDYWRRWRRPVLDSWGPKPLADVASLSNERAEPAARLTTVDWLHELHPEVVDALSRHLLSGGADRAPMQAEIRHGGGAIGFSPAAASFGNLREQFLLHLTGVATDEVDLTQLRTMAKDLREELAPWTTGAAYLSLLGGHELTTRARSAFEPAAWRRLQAAKRTYDPNDLFDGWM